jgi:hypothetical protein
VRYALAAQLVRGRRVLDAGCGVGWGTRLLVAAGAPSVTGLDPNADAIDSARGRVPGAHFVQGNLAKLPWDAGSYDLVVCFGGLANIADQEQALDELVRVLAPDGLLLVSSPNSRAHAAGDPFHHSEFTPDELREAVGKHLPNVAQWNQHDQIASILLQEGSLPAGETREVLARSLAPLEPGTNPYSMVIAGAGPLPSLAPVLCCAPYDQLLHLEALSALLSEERQRTSEDRKRMVKEREQILTERRKMLLEIAAHETTIRGSAERIASLERRTEALRREREHTAVLLLESEQALADVLATAGARVREQEQVGAGLTEQVAQLQREVVVFRTSKSWRFTAPLRALARRPRAKR